MSQQVAAAELQASALANLQAGLAFAQEKAQASYSLMRERAGTALAGKALIDHHGPAFERTIKAKAAAREALSADALAVESVRAATTALREAAGCMRDGRRGADCFAELAEVYDERAQGHFKGTHPGPAIAAKTMKAVSVIVAAAQNGGIGKDGKLPWRIPEDLAHFKRVTTATAAAPGQALQNAVVMGRRTWESIPEKFRPLPGRVNVVLTKQACESGTAYPEGVLLATSVSSAAEMLAAKEGVAEIFVIGGQAAYAEALSLPNCDRIFITRVGKEVDCDAFFPAFEPKDFDLVHVSKTRKHEGLPYDFVVYERLRTASCGASSPPPSVTAAGGAGQFLHEEYQYLQAIREIIETGVAMEDRTGVGTVSTFGRQMRFDLRKTFPLLTTKRTFWRGVVEELLWFVRGDTNAKHLSDKGVKIWDANGSREFLDKRGLSHREEGDLGPVYGFQWRHFGAKYVDMHTDYSGQGVDQLAECVRKIKEDPTDRRILLSAWNPADLGLMALPPCHMFCQFYVANGELSCLMYQRSCDMGLGVPFNIASYSLLTCMMAQVCGLQPGDFVHTLGNAHVYKNHIEPLKTQLTRAPRPFPVLRVNPDIKDIDGFQASDFELLGYNPHGKIAMEMAV